MRPIDGCRSRVGVLFLCFSVGHQSEFSYVRPRMGMKINPYHPTAVVDQRGRLLSLIGRRSDPLSGVGIFHVERVVGLDARKKETDTVRLFVNEGFSAGDGVTLAGQGPNLVLLWLVSGENWSQANHTLALVPIAVRIIEAEQPTLRVDVA